jgi:chromosome segregation ATPase
MNPPQNDATIQVIAERINSMQNDVSDLRDTMRDSMEKMSIAITKLVQMEERQLFMNQSYDRLSNTLDKMNEKCEKIEARVDALEKEQPMNKVANLSEDEGKEIEEIEENEENEEKDEIKKAVSGNINKAIVNIISKKIEKSQKDNFQQNKAIATLIKANSEQLQKSYEANVELKGHLEEQKNIIAQQNRIIKSLANTLSSTPQPRKSLVKGFSEKESFQKGREEAPQGTVLSMSKNYKQVLDLVDGMTFAKGNFDSELSKATTTFESTKVLPENIISRIKQETGITIIG